MQLRVAVINPDGTPAMPTKPSRARRWVRLGKAVGKWNDVGLYYVQLLKSPSGSKTQPIALGIDPGKRYSGIAVQSAKATIFMAHLVLPFASVTKKMTARRILRRARRGRRINRKVTFSKRAHRQKRFDNRRQKKLVPSIRANREFEYRIARELCSILPISNITYEYVQARGNKAFSPVMVGQKVMLQWLEKLAPVSTQFGWQTALMRKRLGLIKNRDNKAKQSPETHAVDGIALAASQFVKYEKTHAKGEDGADWMGTVDVTPSTFRVITRPNIYRRQLHFENPLKGGSRKRKGGTVTPWGFRSGDLVQGVKAGKIHRGWVGGFSETNKVVSIYDHNWKRIGQFTLSKTSLIQRSTGLCSA
jgi:hypothetical protein